MPENQTTPIDRAVEAAAERLWHRFAPSHAIEWDDETRADEYGMGAVVSARGDDLDRVAAAPPAAQDGEAGDGGR